MQERFLEILEQRGIDPRTLETALEGGLLDDLCGETRGELLHALEMSHEILEQLRQSVSDPVPVRSVMKAFSADSMPRSNPLEFLKASGLEKAPCTLREIFELAETLPTLRLQPFVMGVEGMTVKGANRYLLTADGILLEAQLTEDRLTLKISVSPMW